MSDVKYTAVPVEEPGKKACKCRKTFRKAVFWFLTFALIGHLSIIGLRKFFYNNAKSTVSHDNTENLFYYMPILDDNIPDILDYAEIMKDTEQDGAQSFPWGDQNDCVPRIRWQGAKETLLDPDEISGVLYSVKGASSRGSVIIRQDDSEYDYINVTNRIYLSEESLQSEVKVNTQTTDKDFSMEIRTPSFDGPRPTRKCVRIDTVITFPKRVKHFTSLSVDVPNAWISTKDLNKLDFAYLNLRTSNGHITVDEVKIDSAEVETVNGHVRGDFIVIESLKVKNSNGALQVKASLDPWAEDVSIDARSINGQIDFNLADIAENQTVDFYAKSINGGITASIDDAFEGEFSASTLIGYVSVQGSNLHFDRNSRNNKAGYKGDQDDSKKSSRATLEAVTGSIELSFV